MKFRGKDQIVWSLNNYLGLANHPEVRKADAQGAADYGLAYPMGAAVMILSYTMPRVMPVLLMGCVSIPDTVMCLSITKWTIAKNNYSAPRP